MGSGPDLLGKTALVTGGAHRIGRCVATALAAAGADVVIGYHRSCREAEATRQEIEAHGVRCMTVRADAADADQVRYMLTRVGEQFARIDLWVANAGAFRRTPLASTGKRDWDDMIRRNFDTLRVPARSIGPLMKRQGGGCIITVADVAGIRPWADFIPYSVAKSCVIAFTRHLAVALAPRVRANAIAPGPVLFPADFPQAARRREIGRTLLERQGDPRQIAQAVLWLARSEYVTGTVLAVDGGRLLG